MLAFHEIFGYVAIGMAAAAGLAGIGLALLKRDGHRWFMVLTVVGMFAIALQSVSGVWLYQQDERPGSQHMFYGFVILFTLTFGYVYRAQMDKNPALRWGLFMLFVMGLGIRGVMTVGESF